MKTTSFDEQVENESDCHYEKTVVLYGSCSNTSTFITSHHYKCQKFAALRSFCGVCSIKSASEYDCEEVWFLQGVQLLMILGRRCHQY